MRQRRTGWSRILVLIAAAMIFIVLAVLEAMASHMTTRVGDPAAPWTAHIRQIDEALARKNISAAKQAWQEAYGAAFGSRRWEGMVEVGDAYLRLGEVAGFRKAAEAKARQIYLAALFRARQLGSLDGVLRAAEAFAALGDHEVAEQALRLAERLTARAGDAQGRHRVREAAERLTAQAFTAPGPEFDPH